MVDQQEVGSTNAPAYAARTIIQIQLHGAWRHELAHHYPKSRLLSLMRGTTPTGYRDQKQRQLHSQRQR